MPETRDVIVIGSGHNGLVAAAYLARAGLSVEVLERNAAAGGAVTSEELTDPGFVHDTYSSWHPLFKLSATYAELAEELHARGLQYCETPDETTANVLCDGSATIAYRDPLKTAEGFQPRDRGPYLAEINSFGATIEPVGQLLSTELYSAGAAKLVLRLARTLGIRDGLGFASHVLSSGRSWFERTFAGREVGDLYAPWSLHTGIAPDGAGSAFQVLAIAGSLHAVGLPVVKGGSAGFVRAFERLISDHGGRVRTGIEVDRILTRGRVATGVVAGGEEIRAARAVIANTTPTQLYGRLLAPGTAPPDAVAQGARYRYSPRAGMQIHVALKEPLRWRDSRLDAVPIVHLSGGVQSVALACAQAAAGLLPVEPTVVVGQPTVVDPSRAPAGAGVMWIQLQQVPFAPIGDAGEEIDTGDGTWTEALESAFVERVLGRLDTQVENWPAARGTTVTLSPAELERGNPNLVRGDIYAGECDLSQSYLWRPLPGYGAHLTPVEHLYQCGAATYPGPGLNAASGRIVAHRVLKTPRAGGQVLRRVRRRSR